MTYQKLAVVACVAIFLVQIVTSKNYACVPQDDCLGEAVPGAKVPDPIDCTMYYLCLGEPPFLYPADGALPCPNNGHFDYNSQDCVSGSECDNICEITGYPSCVSECIGQNAFFGDPYNCSIYHICKPDLTYTNATCSVSPNYYFNGEVCQDNPAYCCDYCTPYCEEKDLFTQIPDPTDCRSFYICTEVGFPGSGSLTQCPDGEYFNPEVSICVPGTTCSDICNH